MSNQNEVTRVLLRTRARELAQEELEQVSAAAGPPCFLTFTHQPKAGPPDRAVFARGGVEGWLG
jgi:hypothetical protein